MQMKHFKLSKDLTLGQKILGLVLILNLSVILAFINRANAQESTVIERPDGTRITLNGSEESTSSSSSEKYCEEIKENLSSQIKDIRNACSASAMGGNCMQSLFQCSEDNADSEECENYQSTLSLPTTEIEKANLEDQKSALEKLEKEKEKLEEEKQKMQTAVDEVQQKLKDKLLEEEAAQAEYEANVKINDEETQAKVTQLIAKMKELDTASSALVGKTSEQKRDMINFMTEQKLSCLKQSQDKAQTFYNTMSLCMSGRANCPSFSLDGLIRSAGKSLASLAQNYGRTKKRQCLALDGQNEFSIKYRAMQALIKNQEDEIRRQQREIAQNRIELDTLVQVANAQGKLANSQATLTKQKALNQLAKDKILLQIDLGYKQNALIAHQALIHEKINAITEKEAEISTTRRNSNVSLSSKELSNLKEAKFSADYLLSSAQEAADSCECSGAIKYISERSGKNFCGSSPIISAEPDHPVDDEDVTAQFTAE